MFLDAVVSCSDSWLTCSFLNRKICGRSAVAESSEDYVVGQVAGSLFQNESAACNSDVLLQLFSAPGAEKQPMYVAVAKVS